MFGYDSEAIYQDADIEMLEMARAADEMAAKVEAGELCPCGDPGHAPLKCQDGVNVWEMRR